jgi:hypothetical protein
MPEPREPTEPREIIEIRETARRIVIERGAAYSSGITDGSGTENFNKLPTSVYRRVIERAANIARHIFGKIRRHGR